MRPAPLASIIIPTFNYGRFISEAIDSVLASRLPPSDFEIIVVDDGSSDDTPEKLRAYRDRIHYVPQENQGKASATKAGINRARGKYVFNLDADDLFLPEKLESVVDIFDSDPEIVHVGHPALCWNVSDGTRVSETLPSWLMNRKIGGKKILREFYKQRMLFGGGSTFAARTDFLKSCPIQRDVDMYVDEYLVLMALNKGYSYFIEQPLSVWRIHGGNYSEINDGAQYAGERCKKVHRSMDSMKAVCLSVVAGDFDQDIKILYALQTKVSQIAMDEQTGRKSYTDVFDLWKHIIKTIGVFGRESFEIMMRYKVLNRTLPTPLLQVLRKVNR